VYRASDGYLLQYRHWAAAGVPPRARIVALHGIQSHSGWYTYSSRRLAEAGYEVYFLDRRGSGLNPRDRGHALHSERLINDVVQFLRHCDWRREHPAATVPTVLLGVSWGGKLAAATALRHPQRFQAVALLYPGFFSKVRPRWFDLWKLRWIEAIGWGLGRVPIPLNDPALFTDDADWQEFIRRDELALQTVTVSFLLANAQLTEFLQRTTAQFSVPSLLMLAGRDEIIDNTATRACYERIAGGRGTIREYPQARHTLEFEPDRETIIEDLIRWLNATFPPPAIPLHNR
jgi:alpha-beta hydrolase superfamily lysophospholipase